MDTLFVYYELTWNGALAVMRSPRSFLSDPVNRFWMRGDALTDICRRDTGVIEVARLPRLP